VPPPWQDRSGALSPLRAAALVLCALPATVLLGRALAGRLGPRPLNAAILDTGDWVLYLLLLTLLVTPLRRILNWPRLIVVRQILGLAAAAYAAAHLFLYITEQKYIIFNIIDEIFKRFYLAIGVIALIGLAIMARTSGEKEVRRLGPEIWNNLHKMIYLIVPLGIFHFYLKSKIEVTQPILLTGLYVWLMGWRWLRRHDLDSRPGLVGLALASALITLLAETLWYGLKAGASPWGIVLESLDFDYEIKNLWFVLAAGLALTLCQALAHRLRGAPGATRQRP